MKSWMEPMYFTTGLYSRLIAVLVSFLFPVLALAADAKVISNSASKLVAEVTSNYTLGDNDSRIDARNLALQEAKRHAAELAGSYVETELVIENDKIKKDQITTFTAAFLSAKVLKESYLINKQGQPVFQMIIRAELDKSVLKQKAKQLQTDPAKQKQIDNLKKKNASLLAKLQTLNHEINSYKNQSSGVTPQNKVRPELIQRRDEVLSSIEKNKNAIRKVFEKGTLLQLAMQSGDAYQQALNEVQTNVWDYFESNTQITLDDPQFRDNGNGTYDILVKVHWRIKPEPVMQTLARYLAVEKSYGAHHLQVINRYQNQNEKQKQPFSENLYQKLVSRQAKIKVSAGSKSAYITFATGRSCFVSCRGKGDTKFQLQFNNSDDSSRILFSSYDGEQNPIVIKGVPRSALENLTTIDAKVVIL